MPLADPLLQVQNLTVQYRSAAAPALRDFGLDIASGESVALLGQSGCGKTTLALAVLGLLPRTTMVSGSIRFAGQEVLSMPERHLQPLRGAQISLVMQEPEFALNPVLAAGRQIEEVLRAHTPLNRNHRRARARSLLNETGLLERDIYSAYPHQMSGGQRQRVVIAQAIACGPRLLIADEPTSALDTIAQAGIVALIQNLKRQTNLTLLFITHDPALAKIVADRTFTM